MIPTSSLDQGAAAHSRRRIVQGLAWSVPAVAASASAPAFAASPRCFKTAAIVWSDLEYKRVDATSASYTTADPDGTGPMVPLTLTIENTYKGSNIRFGRQYGSANDNLAVQSGTVGGQTNPLVLHQAPVNNGAKSDSRNDANKTTTTFTFDRPVTNLTFTITDIDSASSDFYDSVAVSSASPFTTTKANSTQTGLNGSGTLADPWHPFSSNNPVPESGTNGNGTVRFAGEVTSFQIHYWNQTKAWSYGIDGDQKIFISNLSLTYNACP